MTSRRVGGEGYRDPPPCSPPSSGSEDNGFASRPLVAGLFVAKLSREELDSLAEEGIYGPNGDPREAQDSSAGRRSLQDIPGGTRQAEASAFPPPVPLRTPQARRPRRRRVDPETVEDRRGLLPSSTPGQASSSRILGRGFAAPRGRSGGAAGGSGRVEEVSKSSPSPPAASPPEYQQLEESLSPLFPRCTLSARAPGDGGDAELPEETRLGHVDSDVTGDSLGAGASTSATCSIETGQSQEKSKDGEESPQRTSVLLSHGTDEWGTRLRPPLAVTAGVSADSGTGGDSGSAEVQVDNLATPQQISGESPDKLDEASANGEEKSPGSKTPLGKGTSKQTVKPFTKESLDRLENRTVQLVRDYGFQPRRKTSVEDGAVLPNKFEPFPSNLYGRPLEEIDNFIYDEVSCVALLLYYPLHLHCCYFSGIEFAIRNSALQCLLFVDEFCRDVLLCFKFTHCFQKLIVFKSHVSWIHFQKNYWHT